MTTTSPEALLADDATSRVVQALAAAASHPAVEQAAESARRHSEALAAVLAIDAGLGQLRDHLTQMLQTYETSRTALDEAEASLQDELVQQNDAMSEQSNALVERGEALVSNDVSHLSETATDALSAAEKSIEERLGDEHGKVLAGFHDDLEHTQSTLTDAVRESTSALTNDLEQRMQQLGHRAVEECSRRLQDQAHRTMSNIAEDVGEEIATNLLLTQASLAITGALSPVLPQLIALRAIVTPIKTALKIARGGF